MAPMRKHARAIISYSVVMQMIEMAQVKPVVGRTEMRAVASLISSQYTGVFLEKEEMLY